MSLELIENQPEPDAEFDRDEAVRIIETIRSKTPEGGNPPAEDVAMAAKYLQRSTKTIKRWVKNGVPEQKSEAWTPTRRDQVLLAQTFGNFNAFLYLKQEEDPSFDYSVKTISRGFKSVLTKAQLELLRKGARAFQQNSLVLTDPQGQLARNECWQIDGVEFPFRVRLRANGRLRKVWGIVIIDCGQRLLLEVGVVAGRRPNRGDVMATLGTAIAKYGVPDQIVCDNGLEFLAKDTMELVINVGSTLVPMRSHTPEHKGIVERVIQTLQKFLATRERVPQYVEGPRKRNGELYGGNTDGLRIELFIEAVRRTVVYYNTKHTHSALNGETPQSAWDNDPRPLRMVPEEQLRKFRLAGEVRRVTRHGVRFEKRWYVHPALNTMMGEEVEVRYFPNDLRTVEIYVDGKHLCTAADVKLLDPAGKRAVLANNRQLLREITEIRGEASRMQKAHAFEQEQRLQVVTSEDEVTPKPTHTTPVDDLQAKVRKLTRKPDGFLSTNLWFGEQAA
jgi:transposase InsO family protein